MKHTRKVAVLGTALVALVVTLTACTAPASTPTASPAAVETAAATAAPTATATETATVTAAPTATAMTTATVTAAPTATAMTAAQPTQTAQASQTQQTNQPTMGVYQVITAQEAKQIMDTEKNVTVLDVREPSEYSTGHIPGAKLLPLGDIPTKAVTELADKNAKILVYCRSGRRSKSAAEALITLGYTNVLDMGGILNWPYEVVTD